LSPGDTSASTTGKNARPASAIPAAAVRDRAALAALLVASVPLWMALAALGALFLGERPTLTTLLGGAVVVLSVAMLLIRRGESPAASADPA
jgi:drug/metabolite transporter (DMT)-like permease